MSDEPSSEATDMSSDLSTIELPKTQSQVSKEDAQVQLLQQLQEQLKLQQELLSYQHEILQQQQQQQQQQQLQSPAYPSNAQPPPPYQQNTHWSFTQGLVVGQLSVVFIVIIFIKFFVFADSSTTPTKTVIRDASGVIVRRDKKQNNNRRKSYLNPEEADASAEDERLLSNRAKVSAILEKTYYDVHNHAPESLDWFNVLIAQTISHFRTEALLADNIYHSLSDFLDTAELPEFMDKISLTEIDIGDDFPIFSNCRIKQSSEDTGRLEAKIDVDLSDTLTLGVDTKLLLNHPRPLTAVLPVSLAVSLVRFSGCLTVSLINTNDQEFADSKNLEDNKSEASSSTSKHSKESSGGVQQQNQQKSKDINKESGNDNGTALMFSFSPDYRLEFVVKSLIGSRAKLQDVPKISALVENRLRSWFIERCVEPRFQVVRLPSMWPRTKNTREPVKTKEGDEN
ncbi:MMM1 [Candida theae]|uniref:Maintenance of mitochondrial morphology protein 1 n=1 Tax=Candida theae TaxID=1198502 RepID=A0AAD5FZW3_9ASCO|nr:MMM1 [Candida theae]KAI5962727.1 MMM1 [Candida theae]